MLQWPKYFKHSLGQNFLRDDRVLKHIVDCIDPRPEDNMLEIGAGIGVLTRKLLPKVNHLTVVEVDSSLLPFLTVNCKDWLSRMSVHQEDILQFSLEKLGGELRVVGNLPYNISTPLTFYLLQHYSLIKDMYFMLQKEVGERMAALPGTAAYGRLSVMVQYHCQVELLFEVPPSAFKPSPKVDSVMVKLQPRDVALSAVDSLLLQQVVRDSFSARRKTIKNALSHYLNQKDWEILAIDAGWRSEQLSVEDYVKISNYISNSTSVNEQCSGSYSAG